MRFLWLIICCFTLVSSCDYFKKDINRVPIARVNDNYLYEEDIKVLVTDNMSVEDSSLVVNNFINRWATQQLLIDQAKINLNEKQQQDYDKLVQQYKNDLYIEAYKNTIVAQQLDSIVSDSELENYYDQNKENFVLNDELLKLRYVHLATDYSNINMVRDRLARFNENDKIVLDSISIQFRSFNFNDSIWVKKQAVLGALPVLMNDGDKLLKKSNFAQIQDSLGVYLVKIEDVLQPKDIAPLSHVRSTIKEIILNKRKLGLIKKLEFDITRDAVKNNKFEIYKGK